MVAVAALGRGVGRRWARRRCTRAAARVKRGLGGAALVVQRRGMGCGGAAWGGGEERRGGGLMCLEGGVLGYLYWGGEGFAWGRGQEID